MRSAGRREAGLFLVEGPQAVREAGASLVELFATAVAAERHPDLVGPATHIVDDRAIASLSDAVTPQGIVGVAPLLVQSLDRLPADATLLCVLAEPRDPGNLGTVVRTADAAGAGAVIVAGEAVDPHNGKAVRASAGSLWHLPILRASSVAEAATAIRARGLRLLGADGAATLSLPSAESAGLLSQPTAWVFGTEAHGLAADVLTVCDDVVSVPLHGRAESLNLATAAGICLYASVRAQHWQNLPS